VTAAPTLPRRTSEATLRVSEVFGPTIQGEGPLSGRVAYFLRLMGCNLSCSWCDTPYTWDPERHDLRAETKLVTADNLAGHLEKARLVVLTGGEPMLQLHQGGALHDLLVLLEGTHTHVQVETNGTIAPPVWALDLVDTWVLSPKLPNAGRHRGHQDPRLAPEWPGVARAADAHAKIVCVDTADVLRAARWAQRVGWPAHRLWVMPEGTTPQRLAETFPPIATAAAELGLNVSHRLHTLAWGQERGR
jgi:7-carboxy-7-deazaguanine synthase